MRRSANKFDVIRKKAVEVHSIIPVYFENWPTLEPVLRKIKQGCYFQLCDLINVKVILPDYCLCWAHLGMAISNSLKPVV